MWLAPALDISRKREAGETTMIAQGDHGGRVRNRMCEPQ